MKFVCNYSVRATSALDSPLINYSQPLTNYSQYYTKWHDSLQYQKIPHVLGFGDKFGNREKKTIVNITKEVFL